MNDARSRQARRLQPLRGRCCLPAQQPSPISSGETAEGGRVTDATDGRFTGQPLKNRNPKQKQTAVDGCEGATLAAGALHFLWRSITVGVVLINDNCLLDFDGAD